MSGLGGWGNCLGIDITILGRLFESERTTEIDRQLKQHATLVIINDIFYIIRE